MQVRFGTACGLNMAHMTHWTYVEVVIEPPPVLEVSHPDVEDPLLADDDEVGVSTGEVPPPSSAPPAPVAAPLEVPPPDVAKTMTVYMAGLVTPLVYEGEDAAALLGIFVSQSGSLT